MIALILYALAVIGYMAVSSRQAGGGLGAEHLPSDFTWVPELLFALGFGIPATLATAFAIHSVFAPVTALWIAVSVLACLVVFILATTISFISMQAGHGIILPWGAIYNQNGRKQTLLPYVNYIANKLNVPIYNNGFDDSEGYTKNYCRLYMAVKGFLIGLPIGGLPMLVLWPLGYEIGHDLIGKVSFDPHAVSELVAGAGAGLTVVLFVLIAIL